MAVPYSRLFKKLHKPKHGPPIGGMPHIIIRVHAHKELTSKKKIVFHLYSKYSGVDNVIDMAVPLRDIASVEDQPPQKIDSIFQIDRQLDDLRQENMRISNACPSQHAFCSLPKH